MGRGEDGGKICIKTVGRSGESGESRGGGVDWRILDNGPMFTMDWSCQNKD